MLAAPTRQASRTAARHHDLLWRSIVWAGTGVYAAAHAALIVSRHHRFGVYAFDFGIFDQGLWLLSRFDDPFVTLRGLNLFADHSSYVMVLLSPLYWVWADAEILLVLTVIAIAAAGPLLYGIGRRIGLRPGVAGIIALAYLLHPAVRWATWDNFHPEVIVLPLILGATIFVLDQRPWWAVFLAGLALMTKEDAALLVVPFGLWVAYRHRDRPTGLTIAGLGVAAFTVNFVWLLPFFSPTDAVLYSGRYTEYGTGAFGVIAGAASSPIAVIGDVLRTDSLVYLRDMLLLAPTVLAAPGVLILGAPITLANMLSSHVYQIDLRYHYTIYLLVAIGLAAMYGARRLQHELSPYRFRAIVTVIVAAAAVGVLLGPNRAAWGGVEDTADLERAIALIGSDDVVAATSGIATHLAHRATVYRFPNPFRELDYGTPELAYQPDAREVEWVLVDPGRIGNYGSAAEALAEVRLSGEWTTVMDQPTAVLLRRR